MNRTQLIDLIAKQADVTKAVATKALDAVLGGVTDTLKDGQQVNLTGFGSFGLRRRAARNGRNPLNGNTIRIEASTTVGFKPGKALKDAVKETGK